MLVEDGRLALSTDALVPRAALDRRALHRRPTRTATTVGIVLTGASADGAEDLHASGRGGVAIVQDPATSARRAMPDAALALTVADAVLPLEEIPLFVFGLCCEVPA